MNLRSIYLGISLLALISCKKKEDPQPTAPPANSNPTPVVNYCPIGAILNAYCFLEAKRITVASNSVTTKDSTINAEFYDTPNGNRVNAGTVSMNSMALTTQTAPIIYSLNSPLVSNISSIINWNISGSSSYTAFTYSYTPVYPIYGGQASLPDTCSISNGIGINIASISNYTFCVLGPKVTISGSSFSISKSLLTSSGTFSLAPSEMTFFTPNVPIKITVSVSNYRGVIIGGKEHGFIVTTEYQKDAYLKP